MRNLKTKIVPVLAIVFGLIILIKPDVLALLVSLYLIVYGISELL
ncbi:MAG: DUF3096 domain-containing protein [Candidatus Aenigmarchaeota archaeon]|nr:DUF3096 domain-containing protein [Candidatus Aenigmarchaeota archaeon]